MSNEHTVKKAQDQPQLLTPEERQVCTQIAAGEAPHSQRALALLALAQRVTQAEAGELSGLTEGQVRYWRDKFRQQRLSIFPENQLREAEPRPSSTRPETRPEQARQPERVESPSPAPPEKTEKEKDLQPVEAVEKEKKTKKAKGGKGQGGAKGAKKRKKKEKDKARKGRAAAKTGKKSKKKRKARKQKAKKDKRRQKKK